MRNLVVVAAMAALVGCTATDPGAAPTKVSWQYGSGNGDGVSYPGPAPIYKHANGLDLDAITPPAQEPKVNYAYGAENSTGGNMVQMEPQAAQQAAAPAQQPTPSQNGRPAAPGTHS